MSRVLKSGPSGALRAVLACKLWDTTNLVAPSKGLSGEPHKPHASSRSHLSNPKAPRFADVTRDLTSLDQLAGPLHSVQCAACRANIVSSRECLRSQLTRLLDGSTPIPTPHSMSRLGELGLDESLVVVVHQVLAVVIPLTALEDTVPGVTSIVGLATGFIQHDLAMSSIHIPQITSPKFYKTKRGAEPEHQM